MKKLIFEGAGVAIVTPFHQDGSIDYAELEKLIEFQITSGTDAIVSCGTTGESSTLSHQEHVEILRFTSEKIAGRIPLIASTGSNDTAVAVELSKEAEKIGVDGLLLITPYYNKTSQKGLIEHFNHVVNSVNVPAILYNVPSRTGVNILPETYLELSKNPNVVGIKEANHDISSVAKTIALCGDEIAVYSGEDNQVLPIMALGGKGVISVFSNIMPKEMKALCSAMLRQDYYTARSLTSKYIRLMNSMFMDVSPIPVKEAMYLMGLCSNNKGRMPLTEMSDSDKAKLVCVLRDYQLI